MHRKSLALNEELGRKEGRASVYGNLGLIFKARGDLDQAEAMHRKSLALNEDLGSKEGMASQFGNLGQVYKMRSELDQAKAYWREALALFREIGARPMIERVQSWLDDVEKDD